MKKRTIPSRIRPFPEASGGRPSFLLEQKPFREITIKELCAHSDIARRTFYRHFSSVEDVMAYVVSHIIENFKKHMLQVQKEAIPLFSLLTSLSGRITPLCWSFWNKNNLAHLIFIPLHAKPSRTALAFSSRKLSRQLS